MILAGVLALGAAGGPQKTNPWTPAETVTPAVLARQLAKGSGAARPLVVCAGFNVLYRGAHVPGAVYAGPASRPQGLAALKKWAAHVSRAANLVVYCGCCPMAVCPNIRPAFEALHAMGFTHLRVLVLPHSFARDWVEPGLPVARGR
ncbi:MAG: hypothetical protein ACRD0Y_01090 [Terriglobales bacterium]